MRTFTRGPAPRWRRSWRMVALGATAVLLALAIACGAAEQPQQPAQPAGQTSQVQPAQPEVDSRQPAESATGGQTTSMEQAADGMAKADKGMGAETGSQSQAEPMAAKEMTKEMTSDHPASSEGMMDKAAEPQPEPMAKAMDTPGQQAAESTEAMASHQEPAEPKDAGGNEATVETVPEPTAAPQATQAPAAVETAPEPAAVPEATQAPAPLVVEPVAEVGNEVGNRLSEITLELVGGSTVSTSSLISEGKPTFLFFTSTT